jgi:NarL family two-component system response regulator LiaR
VLEVLDETGKPKEGAGHGILSGRESKVLGLVSEGLSNGEIASRLFITERTVRFHLSSIFTKLGAHNRTQAVALARQRNLL